MTPQSHLFQLIASYLGQDMDLWADTEEHAIQLYAEETSESEIRGVLADIAELRKVGESQLHEVFMARHGADFSPGPSNADVITFLDKAEGILRSALRAPE